MNRAEDTPATETRPLLNASQAGEAGIARRQFLGAGAAALSLTVTGCMAPSFHHAPRLQLTLPAPAGPYQIGTVSLHLVDRSRRDPWLAAAQPRELMVGVWYPARDDSRYPWAPWMPQAAGQRFLTHLIPSPLTGPPSARFAPPVPLEGVSLPVTRARQGAPADLAAQRYPVVLYSPGYGDDRELGTSLVCDLASRGYIVVTTDYTYEAAEVEFPGGRVEAGRQLDLPQAIKVRIADTRFVLHELFNLNSGASPDAAHRPLPEGLAGALDLTRVGMFGHSLGGATAAEAMAADRRIRAGIDLDGSILVTVLPTPGDQASLVQVRQLASAVAKKVGDRPFMIMTHAGHGTRDDATLDGFWRNLSGWRLLLALTGSGHYSFTDDEEFLTQLARAGIIPRAAVRQVVTPTIGTIDPARAVAAQRAYIGAFFGLHLRHHGSTLLGRPSPLYPEIQFTAS